jgi:hypothetical protein
MKRDKAVIKIEQAILEKEVLLDNNISWYAKVRFTQDESGYSWVAYIHGNNWRASFPMKDGNYVKFFKTFAGAKRNFIKKGIYSEEDCK